jgi:hypothetical protein
MKVAALFIDPLGHYPKLLGKAKTWDQGRDARTYSGPWPVVAHPPCQLWVNFAALNYSRWGGAHNKPGNDHGCFASALRSVRRCGGVLEHPAGSKAWPHYGLPAPLGIGWEGGPVEWVCEVWQSAYGHKARKRTWLFYCGPRPPLEALWKRERGTHQVGWFDRVKPTLSKREASASPESFARYLISLAHHANPRY